MNLIDLLTLVASVHGFFLGTLILHKYRDLVANRFLASMLFLQAVFLLQMSLQASGFFSNRPGLLLFIIGGALLMGPLHFLYARHLTRPGVKLVPRDLLHGLPFLLYQGLIIFLFWPSSDVSLVGTSPELNDAWMQRFGYYHPALLIQFATYLLITLRILQKHGHRVQTVFSSLEKVQLTWLRNITWLALCILVGYGLEIILWLMGNAKGEYFVVSSILLALYTFAMGYLGLFNSEVLSGNALRQTLSIAENTRAGTDESSPARYEKSGLNRVDLATYQSRLLAHMEAESPQADSGLTLDQLAGQVGLSPHNLSEVINRGLGQNFFDFVNGYRVRDVQSRLVAPEQSHLTVLALALESGFASKSTFNSIFKKHTGLTPTAYRKTNPRA